MSRLTLTVSRRAKIFSIVFMRLMFSRVQGWKHDIPARAKKFDCVAKDGSELEGALHESGSLEPLGVVILCHPFVKYGMHYFFKNELDIELTKLGYHVVSFNFKGFGRSNIKGHAYFDDILSIGHILREKYPNLPIHLIGCSFGGFHLSHALAENNSLFTSAVLDSVPCSVNVYFKKGILSHAMAWLSRSKLAPITGTQPIKDSLKNVNNFPLLFLHGTTDSYLPEADIEELRALCNSIQFKKFEGCKHLEIIKNNRNDYLRLISQFFEASLQNQRIIGK
jgi:pimeloyl-ACP methyl ester carboxylesterase